MSEIGKILYPEEFNSNKILVHPKFEEELKDILEKSGFKQQFIRLFRQRLRFLDERGVSCIQKSDWFELLKNTNGLYSIKLKSTKNIRIIFKFTDYSKKNISILLCTFEEKVTKDYKIAISIANERFEEINTFSINKF